MKVEWVSKGERDHRVVLTERTPHGGERTALWRASLLLLSGFPVL